MGVRTEDCDGYICYLKIRPLMENSWFTAPIAYLQPTKGELPSAIESVMMAKSLYYRSPETEAHFENYFKNLTMKFNKTLVFDNYLRSTFNCNGNGYLLTLKYFIKQTQPSKSKEMLQVKAKSQ